MGCDEPRQPTNCRNFCGDDWLPRPLSRHCCVMATQIRGRSLFGELVSPICGPDEPLLPARFSTIGRPGLRVGVLVPTSMLPLPTTEIPR